MGFNGQITCHGTINLVITIEVVVFTDVRVTSVPTRPTGSVTINRTGTLSAIWHFGFHVMSSGIATSPKTLIQRLKTKFHSLRTNLRKKKKKINKNSPTVDRLGE